MKKVFLVKKFKYIPGYGHKYMISPYGDIRSFVHDKQRDIKICKSKRGYLYCSLYPEKKIKSAQRVIASLVLETWGPPKPSPSHKVMYMDGNKENISVNNLKWATQREISNRTINKLGGSMRKRKPVIIYVNGTNDAIDLLKRDIKRDLDTGKPIKNTDSVYVFTSKGYDIFKQFNTLN